MRKSIFPYPGGKSKYTGWITSHIPPHTTYVEVFGGSADVLFSKEPSHAEVYNDLDSDLVDFFRVLRDNSEELQEFLSTVPFSKELYDKWTRRWYEGWRPSNDIKKAGIFYFSRYAQWGGKYDEASGFARTVTSRNKANSWQSKKEQLENFSERWDRVTIENTDYKRIFEIYDDKEVFFYCDPPYMDVEDYYQSSATTFEHDVLVNQLQDLEADWMVSYGQNIPDQLQNMKDTHIISQEATRDIDRAGGRDGKESQEALIMNYPPALAEESLTGQASADNALVEDW